MIRLGRISYVNMAPVFHRLTHEVEEVTGVPTELNRMLLAGEIDVAPISSIEYARNAHRLRLLPRLCVSSEGAVDSIQLVTRAPLGQVRSVAVTSESATSVVLTRVLLPRAEILPLEADADARLLIGDAALRSAFEDPTPHHDLGRLWLERTGLPMVFAVWAAPEPAVEGLGDLQESLVASVQARALRAGAARARGERALRLSRPDSSPATSRSSATASGLASARGSTRSSRWRGTWGSSSTSPSCASSPRSRRRHNAAAACGRAAFDRIAASEADVSSCLAPFDRKRPVRSTHVANVPRSRTTVFGHVRYGRG